MTKGNPYEPKTQKKKVLFKQKAETMSGDEYEQDSKILFQRAIAKNRNSNAMVFNPKLAATTPILDGKEQTDDLWPSQDPANTQSIAEKYNATMEKEQETPLTGKWTPEHAGYKGWFGKPLYGGKRKTKKRSQKKIKEMSVTTKYDELFLKLSKSLHDTEYAHVIEDKIFWLFVSDVANSKLKPNETTEIAKKINDVIIEGRKDAGRWFA